MGDLLQFQTKAERAGTPPLPPYHELSPEDQFKHLYHKSLVHARDLAAMFRRTEKFTPEHEQMMIQIVGGLKAISMSVTGYTGENHGPTENVG